MRNPRTNASYDWLAPNSAAMTLSRTRPVTRLISTAADTTPADRAMLTCWSSARPGWGVTGMNWVATVDLLP